MFVKCDSRYPHVAAPRGTATQKLIAFMATLAFLPSTLALASSQNNSASNVPLPIELSINGQPSSLPHGQPLKLPSAHSRIQLTIDPSKNLPEIQGPRIQYRLRELDPTWQEKQGWMAIGIRFLDPNRDSIKPLFVEVKGKSPGWKGSPERSTFTPNQLRATIPPGAAFVSVFIISAGPPATVGTSIVKGLRLAAHDAQRAQTLIQDPDLPPETLDRQLPEWHRAGLLSAMASRLNLSWLNPPVSAFQIRDHSPIGHCEWVSPKIDIQFLNPGTELTLTWEEMYDFGLSEPLSLTYSDLAPGLYHLDLKTTDSFGFPAPATSTVAFIVPPPFWTTLWFSAFIMSTSFAAFFGVRNRIIRNRLKKELAAAHEARLIETERMRIARDIHDDLGARLTQISLVSAFAQNDPSTNARQTLTQISVMAKDLVAALHETLWTVNPENDHLNAVSDFICHLAQTLCETAGIRYRVHAQPMPPDRIITSNLRHHIILAVKESVNNAIKHGAASQLTLNIALVENTLSIAVSDNGRGFNPQTVKQGNGLQNMQHRMQTLNGLCQITPAESGGTQIRFSIPLPN